MNEAKTGVPLVQFREVTCVREGRTVLHGVSFELSASEVVALVGPNGSGKSTLLGCAAGQLQFDGTVEAPQGALGVVPQSAHASANLPISVLEFVVASHARRPVLLGVSRADREQAAATLERVGLDGFGSRDIRHLSTGEWKRCLLAAALCSGPRVLLLDEAEAGLDAHSMERFTAAVQAHAGAGGAVLWATHHAPANTALVTRTLTLQEGRLAR